jgi:hypothetical protein
MKMASATLTVDVTNSVLSLVPTSVSPANSVAVSGTGPTTQMTLTPQSSTDTTFLLTFTAGANVSSLKDVTLPVPFGEDSLLTISGTSSSIDVTAFDLAPFQGSSFPFTVEYLPVGSSDFVREDPTIVFNPPST